MRNTYYIVPICKDGTFILDGDNNFILEEMPTNDNDVAFNEKLMLYKQQYRATEIIQINNILCIMSEIPKGNEPATNDNNMDIFNQFKNNPQNIKVH
jgi:hypothetical protein